MLVGPYPYHTAHTYLGSMAQEYRLNILSNNMANINTPGFKKEVPVFDSMMQGYMMQRTETDFSQGQFEQTGGKLDLAISGPGFFQVETREGIRYTRAGSFTLNALGEVMTPDGHRLAGAGIVPEDAREIIIDTDGRMMADGDEIGRIELFEFEDPKNSLTKAGHNLFALKQGGEPGRPADETTIDQGYLEKANVNAVDTSINMIDTIRTYETFQKIVLTMQEIDSKVINDVGRLG